jgi:hypothetical protein
MDAEHPESGADLDYTVQVHQRNGRYFLRIRELNLIVEADDVEKGYAEIEHEARALIERHIALGKEAEIPPPEEVADRARLKQTLTPFFIKAAVVALVGGLLVATSHVAVLYALQEGSRQVGLKAGRAAIQNFTSGLERFAERDMPPERQERLRLALRAAVARLQPFAPELAPLFGSAEAQPSETAPANVTAPGRSN